MRFINLSVLLIVCAVSSFAQTPVKQKNVTGDVHRYADFPTKYSDARNIDVWLPPGYAANAKKRYAVLYMHDGQNLFNPLESFRGIEWGVDETMTRLIKENKVRETIVVAIWNTQKRTLEFMPQKAFKPPTISPQLKNPPPQISTDSGSDAYLRFIVRELKPFIDSTYRTESDRDNTFVMGSSMGALMALYAISEYPDVFGGAGCLSTQFPLGRGAMLDYMAAHLPSPEHHKIYFDFGTETLDAEYAPFQAKADAIMQKNGYRKGRNWNTLKFPGADHSETSWSKRVQIPLEFLLKK